MTPDLTTTQTIAISATIASIVLVIFLTALLFLTFQEQIRRFLRAREILVPIQYPNTDFRNTPFPYHYVLPFQQPERLRSSLEWPSMATGTTTTTITHHTHCQATTTYAHSSSSDEYFMSWGEVEPEPRNATLGPSNVHRTPTPEPTPTTTLLQQLWIANPDPWTGESNAVSNNDPDYPTIINWDQPVRPDFRNDNQA
ncbi:hypothetical protein EDD85DRAFT_791803 [Armillaria nabsnona]|nr:hypothetical protein EDD85DRAFT_791803 [Armillaria nabsnona]